MKGMLKIKRRILEIEYLKIKKMYLNSMLGEPLSSF
jgi:hypothetical protein